MPVSAAIAAVAVFLNGHQVMLPTAAIQRGGTVLVPVKGIFDRLGASISWDPQGKAVAIAAQDLRLDFTVGATDAQLNGQTISLGAPAEIQDGNALVPLRLVATALGPTSPGTSSDGACTCRRPRGRRWRRRRSPT